MKKSANFSTQESVEKLADILVSARFFKGCSIMDQRGRKIKVEIEYATAEVMGSIVISDMKSNQVLCRRETIKKEAH